VPPDHSRGFSAGEEEDGDKQAMAQSGHAAILTSHDAPQNEAYPAPRRDLADIGGTELGAVVVALTAGTPRRALQLFFAGPGLNPTPA
jgi:hypothetical protein